MAADIRQFLVGSDNLGVLLHDPASGATASIDAGDEAAILGALDAAGWTLTHILVTHHHGDHIVAVQGLKSRTGARVIGPARDASRIPGLDEEVAEGDRVSVGTLAAVVLETPGHTSGHIAYHFPAEKLLFAGDTLFAMGCGRLFEGSPAQMWASLQKLAALPPDTQVYCGHEYTQSNARFALTVDGGNAALVERARAVDETRRAGRFTIPTTIGLERATNPFLRAGDPAVAAAVGLAGHAPVEVFAELRERKNRS
jgi:hydroxyacylglutathione hydrolase